MNIIRIAVLAALLFSCASISLPQGYRGIVPLHSTCEDVKRILGVTTCEPTNEFYEFEDESVGVTFSKSSCEVAYHKAWNVPPGTVLDVKRILKKRFQLSALRIDFTKYKKISLNDDINTIVYENQDEGISYWTISGDVTSIHYFPSPKDEPLLCPIQPEPETRKNKIDLPSFWFDRYGDLSFSEEQKHLDLLAQELKEHPITMQVYIVVYPDQRFSKYEANVRAKRAKDYLTQTYDIASERIKTIVEDQHKEFEVRIYIIQPISP
jgi:hypothetical protein